MKGCLNRKSIVILALGIFIAGMVFVPKASADDNRVIVLFDPETPSAERRAIVQQHGGTIIRELSIIPSIVINLPEQASDKAGEAIMEHAPVIYIEDDLVVEAFKKPSNPGGGKKPPKPQPPQTLPWGVDEIDAELAWAYSTGASVNVAILDTGIDTGHPDLADNIGGGVNIINPRKHYKDDNGHGTHVAGTVAAINNTIGVVGVSHEASLWGVKVLNRKGVGWLSDILAGLQWCIDNGMDVINMSLGTPSYSQALQDAVSVVYAAGIVQVAAAGNHDPDNPFDYDGVNYPAAYSETIAVSATNNQGNLAEFSCYGAEVDLAAPGDDIYSTYKGESYKTLDGTSMAAPHVTGTVTLILENKPAFVPDEVLAVLKATADDLGLTPDEQGAGLVDAEAAAIATE